MGNDYEAIVQAFVNSLDTLNLSQEEYLEALQYAMSEIEVFIQACKETM